MIIRNSQVDSLTAGAMDNARRQRLLALRERGFDVNEVGGAILIRDRAGGLARVESRGLIARVSSAEGRTLETEQYANGRIRRIVDASGREVQFVRDAQGFLQAIDRGPSGGTYRFQLSREWQPLRIEYPDGTASLAQYSPDGQPTRIVQRDGTEIRYEYAPDGRLALLIDPQGRHIRLADLGPGVSRRIDYPNGCRSPSNAL
jgi:YD repeat-containing protein